MSIFTMPNIETIIYSYLDQVVDWNKIKQTNKYYKNRLTNNIQKLYSRDKYRNNFTSICRLGHLETAKYAYYRCCPVDIPVERNLAFFSSCLAGDLEMAKWLYEISLQKTDRKINIYAYDNQLFRRICNKNNVVSKWLIRISKKDFIDAHQDNVLTSNDNDTYPQFKLDK